MSRHALARTAAVVSIALSLLAVSVATSQAAAPPPPTITSITPDNGVVGTSVTIVGTGFGNASKVTFNGTADPLFEVISGKKITAHVPEGASTGPIAVTTPNGTATSPKVFIFIPEPDIALTPDHGPPGSATTPEGVGFGKREVVDLYLDTTDEALAATNRIGEFSGVSISVPSSAAPGIHWITAVGRRSGLAAQSAFTVRADWPQSRYSAKHAGTNPTENVLNPGNVSGLGLDWSYTAGSIVNTSAAVANGVAYMGSEDGNINALDAATGAFKWSFATDSDISSTPAVANGIVYVGSFDSNVYALDASTGALQWAYTTGGAVTDPTVANGSVYVDPRTATCTPWTHPPEPSSGPSQPWAASRALRRSRTASCTSGPDWATATCTR